MINLRTIKVNKLKLNIQFWIAIAILVTIAVIYYTWYDRYEWFWRFSILEFRNDIIGSLFLIPFIYASLVSRWQGSLIVWLLSMAVIMPRIVYYSFGPAELARNISLFFVPLTIVMTITLELKWRERQKQVLMEREEERQLYMSQILKAQEDERRRIAQELHDDTTQELLTIANRAQAVMSTSGSDDTEDIRKNVEWIRDAVLHVSENVRRLSLDLRPSILDNIGLVSALRWLAGHLNEKHKIKAKFKTIGAERKLNPETEVQIFRIVQEALNNVWRHSNATEASITLKYAPESFEIKIQDNGQGFSLNKTTEKLAAEGKFGIIGMQQRAKLIEGNCCIESYLGKGTLVSINMANPESH
jgi:signal transduction histidine kinase